MDVPQKNTRGEILGMVCGVIGLILVVLFVAFVLPPGTLFMP